MTYLSEFYHPLYLKDNQIQKVLDSLNIKDDQQKIETGIESIYTSSNTLKNLRYIDTKSLYLLLQEKEEKPNSLFSVDNETVTANAEDVKGADKMDVDNNEEYDHLIKATLRHRIDLEHMGQKPEVLTISIGGFPTEILHFASLVENFLNFVNTIIQDSCSCEKVDQPGSSINVNGEFEWAYMGIPDTYVSNQEVFVTFKDSMMLWLFVQCLRELAFTDDENTFSLNVKYDKLYDEVIVPKFNEFLVYELKNLDKTQQLIVGHMNELLTIAQVSKSKIADTDDYLAKCRKLSETYRVDNKDLADVPPYLIEYVKQRIIEFRLYVLSDLEKKQKAKQHLKHQTTIEIKSKLNELYDSKEMMGKNISSETNISDLEYETKLQMKEKAATEKKYTMHLTSYQKKEDRRLRNHHLFKTKISHETYQKEIIPKAKAKFLENFVTSVSDSSNKIDSNFSYYTKRSNYMRYRAGPKQKEEELDHLDREAELAEQTDETPPSREHLSD